METQTKTVTADDISELYEQEAKERRVLAGLLERYTNQQGKYLATRGEMGEHSSASGKFFRTPSYVVSHDLMWIAVNLKMGSEMPLMVKHIDDKGKIIVDESNVEEIKQRQPDWSRQGALTAYLAKDRMRKFGTILAVISPDWVDNPHHENWGKDKRALKSAAIFEPLDNTGRVGLLGLEGALLYALDGQHRVMGLRGIKDLIENSFTLKKANKAEIRLVSRDEFLQKFDLELHSIQTMMSERMHVEYIPAVLPGETREEASRRVRSVFVAINSHAKKPTKGENYLLDEVDGYAVVARRVGVRHPFFRGTSGSRSRINWKNSALPERSEWYTTLEALKEMTESYLKLAETQFAKQWAPPFGAKDSMLRPSEEEIDLGIEKMSNFLTHVAGLPVFQELERSNDVDKELSDRRSFPDEEKGTEGHGHLLLRPIGQIVLANAVAELVNPASHDRMSLDDVFKVISVLDRNGRFEAHLPANVWYGVTYNFHKKKMDVTASHRDLAVKLLVYMVRGANEAERGELLQELIAKREVEKQWTPFTGGKPIPVQRDEQGNIVTSGITLPQPRQ
jgi:DGQHR domain-containing protein